MTRTLLSLLVLLVGAVPTCAQWSLSDATTAHYQALGQKPLIVELTGCERVDRRLRKAVEQHWHQGAVMFSDEVEPGELVAPGRAVLRAGVLRVHRAFRDFADIRRLYLNDWEVRVNRADTANGDLQHVIAFTLTSCFPRDICGLDEFPPGCEGEVELAIIRLNDVLEFLKRNTFDQAAVDWYTSMSRFDEAFNGTRDLEGMTKRPLLIDRRAFSGLLNDAAIDKAYPYPHEIVDHARFVQLLEERNSAYNYLLFTEVPTLAISVHDMSAMRTLYVERFGPIGTGDFSVLQIKDARNKLKALSQSVKRSAKK